MFYIIRSVCVAQPSSWGKTNFIDSQKDGQWLVKARQRFPEEKEVLVQQVRKGEYYFLNTYSQHNSFPSCKEPNMLHLSSDISDCVTDECNQ